MFDVVKRDIGDVNPTEYIPGNASLTVGSAAYMNAGKLTKCTPTTKPEYIIVGKPNSRLTDVTYPALKVLPSTYFKTTAAGGVTLGTAVTLNSGADGVTTTTSSGVFKITKVHGNDVEGYFVAPQA